MEIIALLKVIATSTFVQNYHVITTGKIITDAQAIQMMKNNALIDNVNQFTYNKIKKRSDEYGNSTNTNTN
jgi:hypothetical protein